MTIIYQRQLNYIFNRPTTEPAWYWGEHWEEGVFEDSPLSAFTFMEALLSNVKADLSPYSNDQIGLGLSYIFDNSCSNLSCDFKEAEVPFERKLKVVQNLFALFRDIFNPRCVINTSAGAHEPQSRLNYICYMFWDVTPLASWTTFENRENMSLSLIAGLSDAERQKLNLPDSVWQIMQQQIAQSNNEPTSAEDFVKTIQQQHQKQAANRETKGYHKAIAHVMRQCLELSNPACVESGLHGLGHLAASHADIAVPIIDAYLKKGAPKELLEYAKMARTGMIL